MLLPINQRRWGCCRSSSGFRLAADNKKKSLISPSYVLVWLYCHQLDNLFSEHGVSSSSAFSETRRLSGLWLHRSPRSAHLEQIDVLLCRCRLLAGANLLWRKAGVNVGCPGGESRGFRSPGNWHQEGCDGNNATSGEMCFSEETKLNHLGLVLNVP